MSPEHAAVLRALKTAEQRIQRILAELEEETGRKIEHVSVDTRNYAELNTEISLAERPSRPETAPARA